MTGLLLLAILVSGCASAGTKASSAGDASGSAASSMDTGNCRPFFQDSPLWSDAPPPRHSCWNLLWEVPATIVVVPVFLGVFTAPVWVPLILLK